VKEVFKQLGSGVIEQYTEFRPDGASPAAVSNLYKGKMEMVSGGKGEMMKYAFGAEFVEVHIHRRTREIRVPRIVGALAGGRIMNTRTARSQLMGGMIWGISSALHEATEFDRRNARVVNRDLQDYLIRSMPTFRRSRSFSSPRSTRTSIRPVSKVWESSAMSVRRLQLRAPSTMRRASVSGSCRFASTACLAEILRSS
jgi:hypothetical protein